MAVRNLWWTVCRLSVTAVLFPSLAVCAAKEAPGKLDLNRSQVPKQAIGDTSDIPVTHLDLSVKRDSQSVKQLHRFQKTVDAPVKRSIASSEPKIIAVTSESTKAIHRADVTLVSKLRDESFDKKIPLTKLQLAKRVAETDRKIDAIKSQSSEAIAKRRMLDFKFEEKSTK